MAGRRGAVVEDNFYNKLERLNVQAGKKEKILASHVQRICEAHDTEIRSYYQQIHGSSGADTITSMENLGEQVYVPVTSSQSHCHQLLRKVEDGARLVSEYDEPTNSKTHRRHSTSVRMIQNF